MKNEKSFKNCHTACWVHRFNLIENDWLDLLLKTVWKTMHLGQTFWQLSDWFFHSYLWSYCIVFRSVSVRMTVPVIWKSLKWFSNRFFTLYLMVFERKSKKKYFTNRICLGLAWIYVECRRAKKINSVERLVSLLE